jgi:hypothetical protein
VRRHPERIRSSWADTWKCAVCGLPLGMATFWKGTVVVQFYYHKPGKP